MTSVNDISRTSLDKLKELLCIFLIEKEVLDNSNK